MKPKQLKPPLCLACGKPCWREGHMAEMHIKNNAADGDISVSVCMYCGAPAGLRLVDGEPVIRPLTEAESERMAIPLKQIAASFQRKRAMAAIFGGNLWDY